MVQNLTPPHIHDHIATSVMSADAVAQDFALPELVACIVQHLSVLYEENEPYELPLAPQSLLATGPTLSRPKSGAHKMTWILY